MVLSDFDNLIVVTGFFFLAVLGGFEQFALAGLRRPLLQPGRAAAAGAPGPPANVGTYVDVDRSCKCWNNMFNILTHP